LRTAFVERVLSAALKKDPGAASAKWLAVCAGGEERTVFLKLGFADVTISNLDVRLKGDEFAPYAWSKQNAQSLDFPDGSFDYVFVSDGLHHCSSPHQGLLEMYRVARKAIVVVESRDSALVRLAERLGIALRFEVDAVVGNGYAFGGVNNTQVPNFVYRWTERELRKTVASYDPSGPQEFRFFYALNLPERGGRLTRTLLRLGQPALSAIALFFPRQCNSFAMTAYKQNTLWPWLIRDGETIEFRRDYAG
jgi:SAM-dependent methyltransferase